MRLSSWNDELRGSTRGRVLALLRRADLTVDQLATELGLSGNAVRAHLARLERDGLVRQVSTRRSARKPAHVYAVVPESEQRLSPAYLPFAVHLCRVLAERLPADARVSAMRAVGRAMAGTRRAASGTLPQRAAAAVEALGELGGAGEVVQENHAVLVRGHGCPLGAVTQHHPEACAAVETMLATILDCEVEERCERGERSRCRFTMRLREGAG